MRAITKICKWISHLLLIVLLALAALLLGPRLLGLETLVVLSGSMEPALRVGGLVYVRETPPEEIRVGDVITFTLAESDVRATHRVVEIRPGERAFVTKGDANEDADGAIAYDRLVGRVVWDLPYLGFLVTIIQGRQGILLGAGILILLVLTAFLPEIFKPEKSEAEQAAPPEPPE
ncbi:MAG: signal peptidase I [Gracilibacteraceae bacterium]|jgi:signal peptidase|nr:signal peptidase I [Gracilibacteraceae bacterium]